MQVYEPNRWCSGDNEWSIKDIWILPLTYNPTFASWWSARLAYSALLVICERRLGENKKAGWVRRHKGPDRTTSDCRYYLSTVFSKMLQWSKRFLVTGYPHRFFYGSVLFFWKQVQVTKDKIVLIECFIMGKINNPGLWPSRWAPVGISYTELLELKVSLSSLSPTPLLKQVLCS